MEKLDDIFEIPEKNNKILQPQKEDPEIKKYVDNLMNESVLDAETESDIVPKNVEKKPRKKHNIPPEKLEIMRANLKKGRDAIKAKKEARLRGEIKEQVIKEMKQSEELKKPETVKKPEVVKQQETVKKPEVVINKKLPEQPVVVKPYVVKSLFKTPIW